MENSDEKKFRKFQMALLNYHMYKLNKNFNTGEVSDEPIKCFLVDKNRLNSLKSDNNYSDASRYFNTNIERYLNDYQRFRNNLFKAMEKENSIKDLEIIYSRLWEKKIRFMKIIKKMTK